MQYRQTNGLSFTHALGTPNESLAFHDSRNIQLSLLQQIAIAACNDGLAGGFLKPRAQGFVKTIMDVRTDIIAHPI